jgi:hypothetical protein
MYNSFVYYDYDLLFNPEPKFTERGSIVLWRLIKKKCKIMRYFSTPSQFKGFLNIFFEDITGFNIRANERIIYVETLDNKKGISAGRVSIPWWRVLGIPVLVRRFSEKQSPFTNEIDFIAEKFKEMGMLSVKPKREEIQMSILKGYL